jgi:hypothetical protein
MQLVQRIRPFSNFTETGPDRRLNQVRKILNELFLKIFDIQSAGMFAYTVMHLSFLHVLA